MCGQKWLWIKLNGYKIIYLIYKNSKLENYVIKKVKIFIIKLK
jgi:hypothetical protein